MNVYEASAVLSPVAGLLVGISETRGSTLWGTISGVSIGLTMGLLLPSAAMLLVRITARVTKADAQKGAANLLPVLGTLGVLLEIFAAPATMLLTSVLVKAHPCLRCPQ